MSGVTECQPSQSRAQIVPPTSPVIVRHDRDAQPSTLSYACALKTGLTQVRAITQTSAAHQAALSAVNIDETMGAVRQLTCSAPRLSCSNALAPISTLPPELLARIFHFQVLVEPPWSFGVHLLGWIKVTHVCRRWRYVALDDSTLWARISGIPRSMKWLYEILVRAHNTPFSIDLGYIPKREILTRLPLLIANARELRLRSPSLLRTKGVQDICEFEAPELELLELGTSVTSPITFLHLLGKTLFMGRTPKLRTLSLTQVLVPWSLLPRGQLTQLRIMLNSKIPIPDPSSPIDLNQLVELLINSPELEVVILELCLPTILSRPSPGQHIHLPRLSHLHLGGPTSSVTDLLRRFLIPSSTSLYLHCISENLPAHGDHLIHPLVSAASLHHCGPVEFKSLKVTANYFEDLMEVAASISPPKSTNYNQHVIESRMVDEAKLTISFNGLAKFGPSDWADILVQLCGILPISHLEFLSISVHETIQSVNWYELFSRCKNITTIQARGRGTCGLLQCLAPIRANVSFCGKATKANEESEMKRDNGATQVQVQVHATENADSSHVTTPYPKLSCLLLQNLSFDSPVPYSSVLVGNVLIDALRWRQMNNSPVKTLSVDSCIITGARANGLKQYVQEFNWDGDEGPVAAYLEGACEDHDFTSDFDETGVWWDDISPVPHDQSGSGSTNDLDRYQKGRRDDPFCPLLPPPGPFFFSFGGSTVD